MPYDSMGMWYGPAGEGGTDPAQAPQPQPAAAPAAPAPQQSGAGSMFANTSQGVQQWAAANPAQLSVPTVEVPIAAPTATPDASGNSMFAPVYQGVQAAFPVQSGTGLLNQNIDNKRAESDYTQYWNTAAPGSTVDLGGGSRVTRNADGTATWTDGTRSYTYDRNTGMDTVAANTSLGASWNTQYATQPVGATGAVGTSSGASGTATAGATGTSGPYTTVPRWNSFEEFQAWEASQGARPNFGGMNPDYRPPDWLRNMGLSASGSEDQYKRYVLYKNNPQYAADMEVIMDGGVSAFPTDGSTLVRSDVAAMPPAEQQYYRDNPQQLALAEGMSMDPVLYHKVQTGEIQLPRGVNKTQWLREHKWTESGVVENDNVSSFAAADNIGMDGQGAGTYIRPRYNSEGQIVDTDGTTHDPYEGVTQRTPGWNGGSITPEGAGGTDGSGNGSGGGSNGSGGSVSGETTVEGRINNLLRTDASGNYINPVVRQAVDRANQAFAARGLLNSSMAAQAGQEAAISKATEIASADAQNAWQSNENATAFERDLERLKVQHDYASGDNTIAFERDLERLAAQHGYTMEEVRERYGLEQTNTDETRAENLRASYRQQIQQANLNYNNAVSNINNSNMTAEQKQSAIDIAAETRDAELAQTNEMFANTPRWQSEWATVAVRVDASGVAGISSRSRLTSIINDPAQPESVRAAARARLAEINAAPPATDGSGSTGNTGNAGGTGGTGGTGLLNSGGNG